MQRSIAYIDSRNLISYLETEGIDSLCFDFRKFAEYIATNNGEYQKDLDIKLYGARFPMEININRHNRDEQLYQKVQAQNIKVKLGQFKTNDGISVEKGVDVRLATDLIFDCIYNTCNQAYIFSSDTDLIPAIHETKTRLANFQFIVCLDANHKHLANEFKAVGAHVIVFGRASVHRFGTSSPATAEGMKDLKAHFEKGRSTDLSKRK